jgi:hypothetical protein
VEKVDVRLTERHHHSGDWTDKYRQPTQDFYDKGIADRYRRWAILPPSFKPKEIQRPDTPTEEDLLDWDIDQIWETIIEQYNMDKDCIRFKEKVQQIEDEEYRRYLQTEAGGNNFKLLRVEEQMAARRMARENGLL